MDSKDSKTVEMTVADFYAWDENVWREEERQVG